MADVRREVKVYPKTQYFVMWEKRPIGYEITGVIGHDRVTSRHYPITERSAMRIFEAMARLADWSERNAR